MIKIKLFICLSAIFLSTNIGSQTLVKTSKAQSLGVKVTKGTFGMSHVGFIGTREVFLSGKSYKVYNGTREVNKDFLKEIDHKDARDLFFTSTEVIVAKVENNKEMAPIFIQRFDEELKSKGDIKQVGELGILLNPGGKGNFFSIGQRKITIEIKHDLNSGNILLYCHVGTYVTALNGEVSDNSSSTPYVKMILLDRDFNVLNTFAAEASEANQEIDITSPTMLENGEAIALLTQTKISVVRMVSDKIVYQAMIHLAKDKEVAVTKIAAQLSSVASYKTSLNTEDDKVVVSILSMNNVGYKTMAINVYVYDIKTKEVKKAVHELKKEDYKMKSLSNFKGFQIIDIRMLDDGASLMTLNSVLYIYDDGQLEGTFSQALLFVKLSSSGDIVWITPFEKSDRGYYKLHDMNDILSYVNKNGDLDVVFNVHKKYYKKGTYKLKSWWRLNGAWITQQKKGTKNLPVKVTLDLASGAAKIEKLQFGKKVVSCLHIIEAEALDNPGEYIMRTMVSGKPTIAHINFDK